jgi:uncharacterized protein (DUF2345 family)
MTSKHESEKSILHKTMVAVSKVGVRVFRNTVGLAYQGKPIRFTEDTTVVCHPGDILIRSARTVHAGLITGSSDLIGWTCREITEHDMGKVIAQFTAIETKAGNNALEEEQRQFLEVVRDSGGLAIVARSPEQAIERLKLGGGIE